MLTQLIYLIVWYEFGQKQGILMFPFDILLPPYVETIIFVKFQFSMARDQCL